jgi:hypothetical protein
VLESDCEQKDEDRSLQKKGGHTRRKVDTPEELFARNSDAAVA